MKKKETMYFGGIPAEPDVRKIREIYPETGLKIGQIIPYEDVGGIIKQGLDSSRFRSVTTKWRKIVEEETNIIIGVERGIGFRVLAEGEKVDLAGNKLRSAGRAARRSWMIASRVEASMLSDEEKARLEHYVFNNSKIISALQIKTNKALPELNGAGGEK